MKTICLNEKGWQYPVQYIQLPKKPTLVVSNLLIPVLGRTVPLAWLAASHSQDKNFCRMVLAHSQLLLPVFSQATFSSFYMRFCSSHVTWTCDLSDWMHWSNSICSLLTALYVTSQEQKQCNIPENLHKKEKNKYESSQPASNTAWCTGTFQYTNCVTTNLIYYKYKK